MSALYKEKDNGAEARMAEIAKLKERGIKVGVLGHAGSQQANGEQQATVADVATWNEFGTPTSPERPIIRGYVDEKKPEAVDLLTRMGKAVVSGKVTADQGFNVVGLKLVSNMQERMSNGIEPPNAPSTIRRKGSSVPTIDSGQLRSSLTHLVVPKAAAR